MKYADIKKYDISNGVGVRVSLFVSGCTHHCRGCFNTIAWDFNYGKDFTKDTIKEIIDALKPDYIKGLSLLGGEPLELVNQKGILSLIKEVKDKYPNKDIWCYSGYLYEELTDMAKMQPETKEILSYIDVLVDGKFEIDKKDPTLLFRGSSNQRIIDMNKTRKNKKVVLHEKNRRRNENEIKC